MTVAGLSRSMGAEEFEQWKALYVVEAEEREREWTWPYELQAATLERLDFWARNFAVMQGVKKSDLPKPLTIPRPKQKREPVTDPLKMAEWFKRNVK